MMLWFEDFQQDTIYALRWMRSRPLFTGIIVLTLALGIGANTAIFSLANAALLRTLPVRDAAELCFLHVLPGQPEGAGNTGDSETSFSYDVYRGMRDDKRAWQALLAYVPLGFNKIPVRIGSIPEEAAVEMVSGDFFHALGVNMTCGGAFGRADEENGASVAVIGYGLWSRSFGGSCSALGKKIFIKGLPFTVVGVSSARFLGVEGTSITDVWVPLQRRPELNAWGVTAGQSNYRADPKWWCLRLIARLGAGHSPSEAEGVMNGAFLRAAYAPLGGQSRRGETPRRLKLQPARGLGQQQFDRPLEVLLGMVGLVLVIACANVATLLVARSTARRREMGIRLALGGGTGRLFRQLLAESAVLVASGALLGCLLAWRATTLIGRWAELDAPLTPDWTVLLFTLALSIPITFLFGTIPLLAHRLAKPVALLSQGSQSTGFTSRAGTRARQVVLVCQFAIGFALVVGTGLLTRTLFNLETRSVGFAAEHLLVFGVNSPDRVALGEKNALFFDRIVDRMRELPGVIDASYVENRPGSGWSNNTTPIIDGHDGWKAASTGRSSMRWNGVGPNYFHAVGIPVRQGRDFSRTDSHGAPKVAIVNETFAREYFPRQSPLGHTVSFTGKVAFTIVGVARNSVYTELHEAPTPTAWFPLAQTGMTAMHIELRTGLPQPETLIPSVRRTLRSIDPDLAVLQPRLQAAEFASTVATERLVARISLFFGVMALLLVGTGLYGTLSYGVNRRSAELAIRMAVGAQRPQIVWLVVWDGLLILLLGLSVGVPLALGAGKSISSILYNVPVSDRASLITAGSTLALVTLAATWIPARRAASIDPNQALRVE